jgi:hypothetical protein
VVILVGQIIILQLLVAIIISNFDESRKVTAKRTIIDKFENTLLGGATMEETIHIVLGSKFIVEFSTISIDEEEILERPTARRIKSVIYNCNITFIIV